MEVLLPSLDLFQGGMRPFQISETVWLVPCSLSPTHNEYIPLLIPYHMGSKSKSRHTWTVAEDETLVRIVQEHGASNWNSRATELNEQFYNQLPVRQGKQCRERWYNHLDPRLRKDSWRVTEDIYILQKQLDLGNRWSEIAKGMEGRTENSVKNRWKCMMKKAKRRNPHVTDLVDLVLAERNQRLTDDNVSPCSIHRDDRSKVSSSIETESEQPDLHDSILTPMSEHLPSPRLDASGQLLASLQGFTQYANSWLIAPRVLKPRESDFSPSPSVFIRSPR
jgi:hypothetical protein